MIAFCTVDSEDEDFAQDEAQYEAKKGTCIVRCPRSGCFVNIACCLGDWISDHHHRIQPSRSPSPGVPASSPVPVDVEMDAKEDKQKPGKKEQGDDVEEEEGDPVSREFSQKMNALPNLEWTLPSKRKLRFLVKWRGLQYR